MHHKLIIINYHNSACRLRILATYGGLATCIVLCWSLCLRMPR